jgi:hypothetical protein
MSKSGSIGSGPLEEQYREQMMALARVIDVVINGPTKGADRPNGFVLLVFPFGVGDGRCNYLSNGADRKDIVKMLREQANRLDVETQ